MPKYDQCRALADEARKQINIETIWSDAEALSHFRRFTGSEDAEKAVDFICGRLQEYGLNCVREKFETYRSDPQTGTLKVITTDGEELNFEVNPFTFSASCENLEGPILFDETGLDYGVLFTPGHPALDQINDAKRYANFAGKIVYTLDVSLSFALKARKAGARAIITADANDLKYYGCVGGVWGTPDVDDILLIYPLLPHVGLKATDNQRFFELGRAGKIKSVVLTSSVDTQVVESSIPVVTIKGQSDKYVQVTAHTDAWGAGMTDDGISDVALIEMARILKQYEGKLKRTVKFIWWSGHEDGFYAGTTWYNDNHWKEVGDNCAVNLFMDLAGFGSLGYVKLTTSKFESDEFNKEILAEFNDEAPQEAEPLMRAADQSFWTNNVPLSFFPNLGKFEMGGENYSFWHTHNDTFDKCSQESTLRDTEVILKMACYLAACDQLPADFTGFVDFMEGYLQYIEGSLSDEFSLAPVYDALSKVRQAVARLEAAMPGRDTDDIIMRAGGELTRLVHTYGSKYDQDYFDFTPLFPRLAVAMYKTRENTTPEYYLAVKTSFRRQINRITDGLESVVRMIEEQLAAWN